MMKVSRAGCCTCCTHRSRCWHTVMARRHTMLAGYDKLGVDEYYECRPFYSLSVALKEEQKRLEQQTKELQKRMKAMGQEHEAAQKKQTK